MTEDRVIDLEIIVPGTPWAVWDAIATGPGIGSWFIPCDVEGRVGGTVTMDFGAFGKETARVTVWDPTERFAYEATDAEGGRTLSYEWIVQAGDAESSTVRLVNRGFAPGDEPDPDYESMSGGWPIFLENLRLHLMHFAGQHARPLIPTVMVPGGHDDAWASLCGALDVPVDLAEGAHFATSGDGVPVLHGIVEQTVHVPGVVTAYLLVMDAPAAGTAFLAAEGDGDEVACSVWLYLYDDADDVEDRWTPFLSERWPD